MLYNLAYWILILLSAVFFVFMYAFGFLSEMFYRMWDMSTDALQSIEDNQKEK